MNHNNIYKSYMAIFKPLYLYTQSKIDYFSVFNIIILY